jgi:hypothetical protein
MTTLANTDPDPALAALHAAAYPYRIALGPGPGPKCAELANRPYTKAATDPSALCHL